MKKIFEISTKTSKYVIIYYKDHSTTEWKRLQNKWNKTNIKKFKKSYKKCEKSLHLCQKLGII